MEHALRVAAYCRVSTDKEDQLHSLAAQQAYFEGYIARHGWRCAGIFADEGLSGTTLRRPRFAELLRLARSGAVDLILTKEVSRFARNTVDALQVTRRLREQGVGVIFLSDGIDTRDNDGEFRLTIMASVAQEESRKISERTRWGQLQAMRRGVAFGNDTVYGYALRGGALTIRPEQAEVVREVYRKCLEEGKGAHTIARELTEAGVAPPLRADGAWSPAMILRLLHNEKYCGDLLQSSAWKTTTRPLSAGPSLPPSRPSWPGARGWRGRGAAFPPATGIPASWCVGRAAGASPPSAPGVPMGGSTCASFAGDGERDAP